jgi:hypothetical protein
MNKPPLEKPPEYFEWTYGIYRPYYAMVVSDAIEISANESDEKSAKFHLMRILRNITPKPGQLKRAQIFKCEPVAIKGQHKIVLRETVIAVSLYMQKGDGPTEGWTDWMEEVEE